ncbi:DUF6482 family protein [Larsenimonas suaedae]|uniref:DUF6482 family protein n=1 Tax=Larsenimonas suaedae TaxID=1851019 RepID=A0ABU1GY89_9GAMM|nr:DUF6482 family protein [Larsenimonas suaedae]MCM2972912.1 DUF6482 family protein [Larsenimonas suaedae]MDR5897011.1 DUF6482 family protein [Larsenimonas suaedae]
MTFDEFTRLIASGDIDEVQVESMEGDIFLLKAVQNDDVTVLTKKDGSTLKPTSVANAKELLSEVDGIKNVPFYFVQQTPYDEMIGQPSSNEVHKVQMSLDAGS